MSPPTITPIRSQTKEARTMIAILHYYAPYIPLLVDVQTGEIADMEKWLAGHAK